MEIFGWSGFLAFLITASSPLIVFLSGSRGTKWAILINTVLCGASIFHFWNLDIPEENVAEGFAQGAGVFLSFILIFLCPMVLAFSWAARDLIRRLNE